MSVTPGPVPVAIAFAGGIAIAPSLPVPAMVACAAGGLLMLAARRRAGGAAAPAALALLAVVALGVARGRPAPPPRPPDGATADDVVEDRVVGEVTAPVIATPRGLGAALDTGGATVWLWSEQPLAPGERIAAVGALRTPAPARGPALPDRAAAAAARGAQLELTVRRIERLADEPGPIARLWRWAAARQASWARAIDGAGGGSPGAAALRGIAVGDRAAVPAALDERWRAAGIYHVLSVSGLHLAVIAGLAYALLRRLIAASPWGGRIRPARWAAPPALALAVGYTLITGAQLATLRALIVIALVLIAAMLDRPVRIADAIAIAALAVLAWRPADLFDPSFQLSFTAAAVLAVRPASPRRGAAGWIARGVASSLWVTLATAPITAHHFQQVCPGGVLGNLVLTPVVELIALPLALAGLACGWDAPIAAACALIEAVDRGAAVVAGIAPVGTVAVVGGGLVAVLVALSLGLAARARRGRADAIAWLALCFAWALGRTPPPPGALRVTFVDVGQGDAALIELPDGAVWLIDAGGLPGAPEPAAASAPGRAIGRVLAGYGHDRIDLAIVSHPHPDHYLGLLGIAAPIDELWSAPEPEPEPVARRARGRGELPGFAAVAAVLAARGTRLVHPPLGAARAQAGVELVTWAPRYQAAAGEPERLAADPVRAVNDNSLIVELRYRGRAIVFAGDAEAEGEAAAIEAGLARADVVKVAHHGSATSSSPAFVAATRPALAVVSCGRANRFRFPAAEVIERWRAAGADIARTDVDGTITVIVDGGGGLAVERFVR